MVVESLKKASYLLGGMGVGVPLDSHEQKKQLNPDRGGCQSQLSMTAPTRVLTTKERECLESFTLFIFSSISDCFKIAEQFQWLHLVRFPTKTGGPSNLPKSSQPIGTSKPFTNTFCKILNHLGVKKGMPSGKLT